jgi:DNA-binding winged helix-turn-helix (wHTH) protein
MAGRYNHGGRLRGRNALFLFEDFALDCERRKLRAGGAMVPVEPQVFDILVHLVENRDRVRTNR